MNKGNKQKKKKEASRLLLKENQGYWFVCLSKYLASVSQLEGGRQECWLAKETEKVGGWRRGTGLGFSHPGTLRILSATL
jgi:hypothetical protein